MTKGEGGKEGIVTWGCKEEAVFYHSIHLLLFLLLYLLYIPG